MIYAKLWNMLSALYLEVNNDLYPTSIVNTVSEATESIESAIASNLACCFCTNRKECKKDEENISEDPDCEALPF